MQGSSYYIVPEKWAFSANEAKKHATKLTELGPHRRVGSAATKPGLQYILKEGESIKQAAVEGFDFIVESSDDGKRAVYKIAPKSGSDSAIVVSGHIDSVFSAEGAGDDSSSAAVMLELARGISQSAVGLKNYVIFIFNTSDDDHPYHGAHSFYNENPFSNTVPLVIDMDAIVGMSKAPAKPPVFQTGSPWVIESLPHLAKFPDFDFNDHNNTHTKNDKLTHLGENLLAFLLHTASSDQLPTEGNKKN